MAIGTYVGAATVGGAAYWFMVDPTGRTPNPLNPASRVPSGFFFQFQAISPKVLKKVF